eukprot:SAG31_NODE_32936_length_350_cov_0.617530_1_plen_63_part_01
MPAELEPDIFLDQLQMPQLAASLAPGLQRFSAPKTLTQRNLARVLAALWRDGCVILEEAVPSE